LHPERPAGERADEAAGRERGPPLSALGGWIEGAEAFLRADVFGVAVGSGDQIVDANGAFLAMIDLCRLDLAHASIRAIFAIPTDDFCDGAAREFEIPRGDGTTSTLLSVSVPLAQPGEWVAITVDLTKHTAAERAIAYLATHDPLTGLPNRRLLEDRLRHALTSANRRSGTIAVLFLDIDYFKRVNDSYGHRIGDAVLRAVAQRLQTVLRDNDTVARAGGDEFVVVLEDLSDPTEATRIAERARVAVQHPLVVESYEIEMTVSIGVSLNVRPNETAETLLRNSDDAMYAAKDAGRNQVAVHARDLSHPFREGS
jgi:diguanylate cyclase (GGDEF)-like protein